MKGFRNIFLAILVPLVVSGCATTNGKANICKVVGGVAGGALGAAVQSTVMVVPGIAAGAIFGHVLCMEGDADGDGVSDSRDLCPNTPKNAVVNKDGCPDSDKDGVFDNGDQCPNTPLGVKVDDKGCAINVCGETLANLQSDVYFGFGKCSIDAETALDDVVKKLKDTNIKVHIEGHTDSIGSDKSNLALSQCRADAVKGYLVSHGVGGDITTEGKGETSPIASNETEAGRAENRRVKITVACN